MSDLIHHFIAQQAIHAPETQALFFQDHAYTYGELQQATEAFAAGLLECGVGPAERVAVYLPKQPEAIFGIFGAAAAGACFVPVNPLLKPRQVVYILAHCKVRVLVTSAQRLALLQGVLAQCPHLHTVVITDGPPAESLPKVQPKLVSYAEFCSPATRAEAHRRIDADMAAIVYTSGSTGKAKGVVLSHRNLVAGAHSVANYLQNTKDDRLLAVLPLSFDAGLSQLTTAFSVGAAVVLMDYLLPRDVIRAVVKYQVTGLAAVPTLWNQLTGLEWPEEAADSLRYITNTGGTMPVTATRALRQSLPNTRIYLMYGLTEAFRSTYLSPDQIDTRPESIGKAIPNAEILVVNEQGKACAPGEPGELVHRGPLVALGYWNDPEATAERFKPCPEQAAELPITELAVWSGDQVKQDEEGFLYFIGRKDEMIKTSGYRVSPTEIEEVVYKSGLVAGAAALGLTHGRLGQAILLVVTHGEKISPSNQSLEDALLAHCNAELPNFMVPLAIVVRESLPHNQNGKIDRRQLAQEYQDIFMEGTS